MGRHHDFPRKHTNFKEPELETVKEVSSSSGPALKWLEYGQVLYVDIAWGERVGESKRRPAMYVGEESRNEAIVRPMYSQPRAGADLVTYRKRHSYLGEEIVINRELIYSISTAIVEPRENELKATDYI